MVTIRLDTEIQAPREVVFDAARNLVLHEQSAGRTRERLVEGPRDRLAEAGDVITLEGTHFGVRQRLTVKMIEMDRPRRFVDTLLKGAFRSLTHTHEFTSSGDGTTMSDTLEIAAPFGVLGLLAERLFLERYMTRFLKERNRFLKAHCEKGS